MSGRLFLDTNILIYAIELDAERAEHDKSTMARHLIRREGATLSVQVLGEFYRSVTSRRRESPLSHDEAVAWVQLWKRYDVRPLTVPHVDLAVHLAGRYQINYFDALIVASARLAGCRTLFSEDLNDGQDYDGVQVENPFTS